MTVTRDPETTGMTCPHCQSTNTVRTHEQLGEQLFFCGDCEHSWSVRPGKIRDKKPITDKR